MQHFRTGEISPLSIGIFVSIILSVIINISVAKWRGYRLKPALIAAFLPYVNIYFSLAYLFIAMVKKDFFDKA